jgi:hypothetical protein
MPTIARTSAFSRLPALTSYPSYPTALPTQAVQPRRWRSNSVFGDGPRAPLDRNARARFAYLLDAHHRAARLTRAARDVGRALLGCLR